MGVGRETKDDGQKTMDERRWTMDDGWETMNERRETGDGRLLERNY